MGRYDNREIIELITDSIQNSMDTTAQEKFAEEFKRKPTSNEEKILIANIEDRVSGLLEEIDVMITDSENDLEMDIEEMAFAADLDAMDDDFVEEVDTFGLKESTQGVEIEKESEVSWDEA